MAQRFREAFTKMAKQAQANIPNGGGGAGGSGEGPGGRAAAAAARSATALAVAAGLGYGTYNSIYTVEGGHRAVVFNRIVGMKDLSYGEGLNFNIPWVERPVIYDIRTRPVNLQTLTGSKDLQMVTIAIRVLHKPDPNQLVWIYRYLGTNYDERILPSIMNECAKAVVARYNANELLTKRDLVSKEISVDLKRRAALFNIMLEDVAITHLSFSPEYARAVEAKQVGKSYENRRGTTCITSSIGNCGKGHISHLICFLLLLLYYYDSPTRCRKGQIHCLGSPTREAHHYHQGQRRSRVCRTYRSSRQAQSWFHVFATN